MKTPEHEGNKDKTDSGAGCGEPFADVLARRISRRRLLQAGASVPGMVLAASIISASTPDAAPGTTPPDAAASSLTFTPITLDASDEIKIASGYTAVPFLRWGDPIMPGAPAFDPANQTAAAQARQFGYNCDWIGFVPLPAGSNAADRGLLVVNHEYTIPELMFAGYRTGAERSANPTQHVVDIELEAHGLSIVEIARTATGAWDVVRDSPYNRRTTATTSVDFTGPAAGDDLLKTSEDPSGTQVIGTLSNCAGGVTPWGTIITGEENFQEYFANLGALSSEDRVYAFHERFGISEGASERQWEKFYRRFDLAREPHEPFRFGWAVEVDPYDPASIPKKRTALGRNNHEGHTSAVAPSGRVAIYSGDDDTFEYAYKFVTAGAYDPTDRAANMNLLDDGTLYAARFNDDGTGVWLPLVFGEDELTEANGFASRADVLINARFAADLVGATEMDRPEDFETNPATGKVYLVCTKNSARERDETNEVNPRPENIHGHIIEITEDGNDHAATTFSWEMFVLAGDPTSGATWYAGFDQGLVSPISAPDNLTFDAAGNIWISTDGNSLGGNDGLYAAPTEGMERGYVKQFFSAVPGSSVSGPVFTPDGSALFLSVQHPGAGGTYEEPRSRWPDGSGPPRPTVVLIQATSGNRIGR